MTARLAFRLARPAPDECAPFYRGYVERVPEGDVVDLLARQVEVTTAHWRGLPDKRGDHRYAPGKWTVKEVAQHVIDTERIFATRVLRLARGDTTPLPGFDQDAYVAALDLRGRTLAGLADEFARVRASTLDLVRSLPAEAFDRCGTASGHAVTVRALVYIVAGHERHHDAVLRERYGVGTGGAQERTADAHGVAPGTDARRK